MKNIEMDLQGDMLTIKVDLSKRYGKSGSGKNIIVASTEGNQAIAATDYKIGLYVYQDGAGVMEQKRGRGAPIGSKNALGHGAPKGNKNAVGNKGGYAKPGNQNARGNGKLQKAAALAAQG